MGRNIYVRTLFFSLKHLSELSSKLPRLIADWHPHCMTKKVPEVNFDL